MAISIENTDTEDIFLKVSDKNNPNYPTLFENRLNRGEVLEGVAATIDGNNQAKIDWTAVRANDATVLNAGTDVIVDDGQTLGVSAVGRSDVATLSREA